MKMVYKLQCTVRICRSMKDKPLTITYNTKFQGPTIDLLPSSMHTTNLSMAANRHLPQMGGAAHPALSPQISIPWDLRHKTGDIARIVVVRCNCFIERPKRSLNTGIEVCGS